MAAGTGIEWTEVTWNPTTGCDRISAGCDNCYALTLAKRLKAMGQAKYQNDGDPRTSGPGFGLTVHPDSLRLPYVAWPPHGVRQQYERPLPRPRTPQLYARRVRGDRRYPPAHLSGPHQAIARLPKVADQLEWPANLWIGVSVEHAATMARIDHLRAVPAAVRFLSCEPLIGPLDGLDLAGIDWVIAGGECGHDHRPLDPDWVTAIRDRCVTRGVPFFFKQWGGRTPKAGGRELDGRLWDEMPHRAGIAA